MDSRLDELEAAVRVLRESLRRVEARLALLEPARAHVEPEPPPAPPEPDAPRAAPQAQLALVGRSLIVLGGAYLLRAITDLGFLPIAAGVGAALIYAASFLWLADRAARRGASTSSVFHAATGLFVAYPLVDEMVLRLHLVGPWGGALAVALFAGAGGAVAAHRRHAGVALATALATALVMAALAAQTSELVPLVWLAALLAALGAGLSRRLKAHVAAWPVSLVGWTLALALAESLLDGAAAGVGARLALYAFFAASALGAMWTASASTAGILHGIALGAVWIECARASLHSDARAALGGVALVIAAGGWLAARRRSPVGFWSSYWVAALLVALVGLTGGVALTLISLSLALALLFAARRGGGPWTSLQALAALLVAAGASGLFAFTIDALAGAPEELAPPSGLALALLAIASVLSLALRDPPPKAPVEERAARVALLALSFCGVAGLLAWGGITLLHATGGLAATVRTAILALGAVALALLSRSERLRSAELLVYPILVALGVKLLLEDLRVGVAASLFADFALLGIALIVAPRLRAQLRKQ